MTDTELLVVGLGPAGASAAAAAARAGRAVLAIDKRERLGEPVQCAELIPLPLAGRAQGEGVVRQRVAAMRTFLPSGEPFRSDMPGVMIDRGAFDRALAAEAAAAGARLAPGTRLIGLDPQTRVARLCGRAGEWSLRYRLLVAADGPHSPVAAALGLPPLPTLASRQYRVPLQQPLDETWIWLDRAYPGGYAWLFPRGGEANLGLGVDKRACPDLKRPLEALHRTLVARGVVGEQLLARTGGAIPVGGLRPALLHGAVLFAGDAAGLTHPVSGAGIAAAVASGELAGDAAARALAGEADALAGYQEELREQFGGTLARALARRAEMAAVPALDDAAARRGWIAFADYYA